MCGGIFQQEQHTFASLRRLDQQTNKYTNHSTNPQWIISNTTGFAAPCSRAQEGFRPQQPAACTLAGVELNRSGWLVWLVRWWVGWWVGWLAGWSVGWLAGWLVGWLLGCLLGWLVGWSVAGRLLVGCSLANQLTNQPTDQPTNQATSQPTNQPTS